MKREQIIIIGTGLIIVALAAAWEARALKRTGVEITTETLKLGINNPRIWLFYNTSDVNSRNWYDFGARSSRVLNIPIMNLFYNSIVTTNRDYRVEVIGGVEGVAELLGWENMPRVLQNPKATVSVAEEDWIRVAILKKFGGLWLSPSVVCLKSFGALPKDTVVAFGQDESPMYSSSAPGFRALWSPAPEHPMFVDWEKRSHERLDTQLGGLQIRGDAKSDWEDLSKVYTTAIYTKEELSRDPRTNKKLELEDLFASGTGGRLSFKIPPSAVYIVVPYKDLVDRRAWGWILRSSEEQILESDLAISHIMKNQRETHS